KQWDAPWLFPRPPPPCSSPLVHGRPQRQGVRAAPLHRGRARAQQATCVRPLAAVNSGKGAATAFVTDSAEDTDSARGVLVGRGLSSSAAVHVSRYPDPAGEAWAVLPRARSSPVCWRPTGTVRKLGCRLALTSLPREVLDARWDVVVVDGPSGAGPGERGRMSAIYTMAALTRAMRGEAVDVVVHEMNRTTGRSDATANLLHPAGP
uniref:Uncharacterized protein n=1 Tax=Aegilops tauschii subsp. strangulata TaxID=200361 RepID=A0A453D5P0_AEGTS